MRKERTIRALKIAAIVLVVLGALSWGAQTALQHVRSKLAHKPARFAQVERGNIKVKLSESGRIEPVLKVVVKSKVAGRLIELRVEEGDRVTAGEVIGRLDPIELQRRADQAQADLDGGRARAEQARINADLRRDQLTAQLEQAQADLRAAEANAAKLVAGARPQEIASAEARLKQAETRLAEARRNEKRQQELVEKGLSGRKQAVADLRAAEAALEKAQAGPRPQEIASAEASVSETMVRVADADRNLQRQKSLFEKGFTAREQVDAAQTQLEVARAQLTSAQQQLALLKAGNRPEDIRAAEAQVERARTTLEAAEENEGQLLAEAKANVTLAEQDERDAREALKLLQAGTRVEDVRAAEAQRDRAQVALRNAQESLREIEASQKDIASAEAQVRRLQGSLANLQTQVDDATIVAPISGVVIHRASDPGELITSGTSGYSGAGTELVTIADLSQLLVKANVNEVDVAKLHLDQAAEIRVDAYRDETFPAVIKHISPSSQGAAQQGQQSQIVWFQVEARLLDPDPRLKTGMSADVDVITEQALDVLRLPREAVLKEKKEFFIHLVKDADLLKRIKDQKKAQDKLEAGKIAPKELPKLLDEKEIKSEKTSVEVGLKDDNFYEIKKGAKLKDTVWIKPQDFERRGFNSEGESE